jgi:Family of unknown function (DUF6090)
MADDNKPIKYMRYAIGEIVLVVIGILIALSINNWNEGRKGLKIEMEILEGLSDDLESNESKIMALISIDSAITARNKILLTLLQDSKSTYADSLQLYFGGINRYMVFFPQRMAYETLKSKGLYTLRNDSLRMKVIELYDETYLVNAHIAELKAQAYTRTNNIFNKRLFTLENVDYKVPNDFESLKKDKEFLNTLSHITAENKNFISYERAFLKSTILVKIEIDREIKKHSN